MAAPGATPAPPAGARPLASRSSGAAKSVSGTSHQSSRPYRLELRDAALTYSANSGGRTARGSGDQIW
eukprot:7524195-Pyramimonas_sp.AAC.1